MASFIKPSQVWFQKSHTALEKTAFLCFPFLLPLKPPQWPHDIASAAPQGSVPVHAWYGTIMDHQLIWYLLSCGKTMSASPALDVVPTAPLIGLASQAPQDNWECWRWWLTDMAFGNGWGRPLWYPGAAASDGWWWQPGSSGGWWWHPGETSGWCGSYRHPGTTGGWWQSSRYPGATALDGLWWQPGPVVAGGVILQPLVAGGVILVQLVAGGSPRSGDRSCIIQVCLALGVLTWHGKANSCGPGSDTALVFCSMVSTGGWWRHPSPTGGWRQSSQWWQKLYHPGLSSTGRVDLARQG